MPCLLVLYMEHFNKQECLATEKPTLRIRILSEIRKAKFDSDIVVVLRVLAACTIIAVSAASAASVASLVLFLITTDHLYLWKTEGSGQWAPVRLTQHLSKVTRGRLECF